MCSLHYIPTITSYYVVYEYNKKLKLLNYLIIHINDEFYFNYKFISNLKSGSN